MATGSQTLALLQSQKISAKTTKGQTHVTNLLLQPRTKKGSAGVTKFPFELSQHRYVEIKIYDTSDGDPNQALLDTASGAVDAVSAAFKSADSTGDFISNISSVFPNLSSSISSSYQSITDAAQSAWKSFQANNNGFGNPSLPKSFKDTMFLPLPNDIIENLTHNYATDEQSLVDEATGGILNKAVDMSASKISSLISKATGRQALTYNKNLLAKFTNSNFRSITLTWTLVPNNQREAVAIQEIITKLKAYSSPKAVANKMLLRAPFFAKLVFQNQVLNDSLQFKEVVITNIDVNWSVGGKMETFHDDNPKVVSLSVTFHDREPKTLQAWGDV